MSRMYSITVTLLPPTNSSDPIRCSSIKELEFERVTEASLTLVEEQMTEAKYDSVSVRHVLGGTLLHTEIKIIPKKNIASISVKPL